MGKMEKRIMLALLLFAHYSTAFAQDFKAARIITQNMTAAKAQEELLSARIEEIKKSTVFEAGAVTARQALKLKDFMERENLDNFKNENRTYRRAQNVLTSISNNMSYLVEGIKKSPGNMAIFYKTTIQLTMTSIETFNRMVLLAMNGKVDLKQLPDGVPASSSTNTGNDGYNLLTSTERVELMEECIGELRTLNRAILRMAYKLNTEVAWTYFFHEATPYHYRRINAIKEATNYAAEDIKKLKWF